MGLPLKTGAADLLIQEVENRAERPPSSPGLCGKAWRGSRPPQPVQGKIPSAPRALKENCDLKIGAPGNTGRLGGGRTSHRKFQGFPYNPGPGGGGKRERNISQIPPTRAAAKIGLNITLVILKN